MITTPAARPADYFKGYIEKVYPDGMNREQTVDVGCAFFAGIETAFRFFDNYVATEGVDEEEACRRLSAPASAEDVRRGRRGRRRPRRRRTRDLDSSKMIPRPPYE